MSSLSGTQSGPDTELQPDRQPPEPETAPPSAPAPGSAANGAAPGAPRGLRPDVALLHKAQAGDRGAYGQIVLLYQDRLYNAVLRLVGDHEEARELTQDAFTRGLEKLDTFRGDAAPYTWLFRIAVNLAISQIRKVQRQRTFSLDRPSPNGNGTYAGARDADDQASGLIDRVSQGRQE